VQEEKCGVQEEEASQGNKKQTHKTFFKRE